MKLNNCRIRDNKKRLNQSRYRSFESNMNIDITESICKAYRRIEEENEDKRKKEIDKFNNDWNKMMGIKEFQETDSKIKNKLNKLKNEFTIFKNIMFFKKENVKDMRATILLLNTCTELIFWILKVFMYLLSISFILSILVNKHKILICLFMSFMSWFIARILRVAIFEIDKLNDEGSIVNIFSSTIAFVALIVAIISLFK